MVKLNVIDCLTLGEYSTIIFLSHRWPFLLLLLLDFLVPPGEQKLLGFVADVGIFVVDSVFDLPNGKLGTVLKSEGSVFVEVANSVSQPAHFDLMIINRIISCLMPNCK